jgi:hypothetical protein
VAGTVQAFIPDTTVQALMGHWQFKKKGNQILAGGRQKMAR